MSASVDLDKWDAHLQPLVKLIRGVDTYQFTHAEPNGIFTDSAGRRINFSYLGGRHKAPIVKLLLAKKDAVIGIDDADKGRHYFTLQRHKPSGSWVLSDTRIDLNGWIGMFTESVVVEKVEEIVDFVKTLED